MFPATALVSSRKAIRPASSRQNAVRESRDTSWSRDSEGWKAQRRASVQRMRSRLPEPQDDARDQSIDSELLSSAGRFGQFPRMVDALGSSADVPVSRQDLRQPRGNDMFAPAIPNATTRRRSVASRGPPQQFKRRDPAEAVDPVVRRDPQAEWDSHVAHVLQRRTQTSRTPGPFPADPVVRYGRRSAPPLPRGRSSVPTPEPEAGRRQFSDLPPPPPSAPRQPARYSPQLMEPDPYIPVQRQRQVQQRRRSASPTDLFNDANMYLPGRRTGTIDLDEDGDTDQHKASFASAPMQQQDYTTPGRGFLRVPVHDAQPPTEEHNPQPPPSKQLPLTARYSVNDNDVFVYASCDIRDSPANRRARLREATTAAAVTHPRDAAVARTSTHGSISALAAAALASAGVSQASRLVSAGDSAAAATPATSPVDDVGAATEAGGEPEQNREAVAAAGTGGGSGVWAQLLAQPSVPVGEPTRSASVVVGASQGPSSVWEEMLRRPSAAAAPSRPAEPSADPSAPRPAEPSAGGEDTGASIPVTVLDAAAFTDTAAGKVLEDPREGVPPEVQSGGVKAVDAATSAPEAAPLVTPASGQEPGAQGSRYDESAGGAAGDDVTLEGGAADAPVHARSGDGVAVAAAQAEGQYDSDDCDSGTAPGPAALPGDASRAARGGGAAGLPHVAIHAGVGPAGSALFFDPGSSSAPRAGWQQPGGRVGVLAVPAVPAISVQDAGEIEPEAWNPGTPDAAAVLVQEHPRVLSVEGSVEPPGVWLRDGGVTEEATAGVAGVPVDVPAAVEDMAIVLATPAMEAPEVHGGWLVAETRPAWQLRLPPPARKLMWLADRCQTIWASVFPEKPPEQKKLEAKVRQAVLRGDLHWSVLNDVKQGRRIEPEQQAVIDR